MLIEIDTVDLGKSENLPKFINIYHSTNKFSRWQINDIFLIFPRKQIWHFMQIVSSGDSLHEMLNPVFL